ncbi:DNA cytosine methyltransferase (plasmid) [Clostridium perfringens]
MIKILKQRLGKLMQKNGEAKIFLEDQTLAKINLNHGKKYETKVEEEANTVILAESEEGKNIVSMKKSNGCPVIDKTGKGIREALEGCDSIKITYLIEDGIGKVIIQGEKNTAQYAAKSESKERDITSISFCAGVGISSWCEKKAGFKSVAFNEYNPKSGAEDRYANVYQQNNPDSVMFNIPMQDLKASDLPYADYWSATLDCSDFSKLASTKKSFSTMHLFMHLMRLFWEKPKNERPKAVFIENVEGFSKKMAGESLKLAFEEEGYYVKMGMLDSLDYGSRTKRERFYFLASCYEGFEFPKAIGRKTTPISDDGVMTVDSIDWITPDDNATLKHFVERQKGKMTHNHKITSFNIDKDSYIGTIPKSHHKYIPENILKHPTKEGLYAFIRNIDHLRYLHGIGSEVYLGDSITAQIEAIGQGVCCHTVYAIAKQAYDFLKRNMFNVDNNLSEGIEERISGEIEVKDNFEEKYQICSDISGQLSFGF